MKFVVSKSVFGTAVDTLSKVINAKNPLPILTSFLCEVNNKQLTMTASDSEVTLKTTIPLDEMEGDGRFCVSAALLKQALKGLQEQLLTVTVTTESDNMFTIAHEIGQIHFLAQSADEYPIPTDQKYDEQIELPTETIIAAINRCEWATANDDQRPIMNGIYFGIQEGFLDIVASNGHVLAKSHIGVMVSINLELGIIIPKKAVKMLQSVLSAGYTEIKISERYAEFEFEGYTLTFLTLEGKYPNYNSIIPESSPITAEVERAQLIETVKRVSPFTLESSNMITLHFEADKLKVIAVDYDLSMGADDTVPVEYHPFKPITIGIKASSLLNIAKNIKAENLYINMSDPSKAMVFEPTEQSEKEDITMLAMPMMID